MLDTSALRTAWAPACTGPFVTKTLNGGGRVSVRPSIVGAVDALNRVLTKYGYKTRRGDTGAFNCRRITNGSGYSLHAYGIALDINWSSNPYSRTLKTDMPRPMVNEILGIRTNNGKQVWGWGGNYSTNKDAMHFEIVCRPRDLITGLRGTHAQPVKLNRQPDAHGHAGGGIVREGAKGNHVKFLQGCLNVLRPCHGKPRLVEDGNYGDKTVGTVMAFQTFCNNMAKIAKSKTRIAVDGAVGPVTVGQIAFWVRVVQADAKKKAKR